MNQIPKLNFGLPKANCVPLTQKVVGQYEAKMKK